MMTASNKVPPKVDWEKNKILIIDDQRSASLMLKSLLTPLGIKHIDIADTYDEAVRACRKTHYSVLITDYHLNQALNGSELICLLRSKRLLSSACGIMMISGDHSTEVILSTLSVQPDCFLTKPITNTTLKQKLTQTLTDCVIRQPVYQALEVHQPQRAIELCKQQLTQFGHNQKLSDLLLDLLVEEQAWQQLKPILAFLNAKHPSHKVTIIEAKLMHHDGYLEQAIQHLEALIERAPLCVEALDTLVQYQQFNHQAFDALNTAQRAFHLTPSASHRALIVAQQAADLNKSDELLSAGRVLANHLPIIDISWIVRFAEFNAIFEQLYFSPRTNQSRRQLLQELKGIQQRAFSRLLPAQQPFLTTYGHIVRARFYLSENKPLKAKRRALIGLSHYFDRVTKLPSVILVELLPILIHLGEVLLISEVHQTLSLRDRFDGHSLQRIYSLRSNAEAASSIKNLALQLSEAKALIVNQPIDAMRLYNQILNRYPYSSDANLGYLDAYSRQVTHLNVPEELQLDQPTQSYSRQRRQAISVMPLPADYEAWRSRIFNQLDNPSPHFNEPPAATPSFLAIDLTPAYVDSAENHYSDERYSQDSSSQESASQNSCVENSYSENRAADNDSNSSRPDVIELAPTNHIQ
ncbi:response regulator [Photobacterium swingsii]|uniref:response regulator n=1 Tax=Photobacterium swingsii TaxID=680026 RepID=UPI00352D94D3